MSRTEESDLWIVYDGDCPLCGSYVLLYRVRENVGHVHLLDAREPHPVVDEVRRQGFDLDAGMAVRFEGRFYHGPEAVNILAILGSDDSAFNRLNKALFRRPRLARLLYPWLARGRLILLRLLHRPLIGEA